MRLSLAPDPLCRRPRVVKLWLVLATAFHSCSSKAPCGPFGRIVSRGLLGSRSLVSAAVSGSLSSVAMTGVYSQKGQPLTSLGGMAIAAFFLGSYSIVGRNSILSMRCRYLDLLLGPHDLGTLWLSCSDSSKKVIVPSTCVPLKDRHAYSRCQNQ